MQERNGMRDRDCRLPDFLVTVSCLSATSSLDTLHLYRAMLFISITRYSLLSSGDTLSFCRAMFFDFIAR